MKDYKTHKFKFNPYLEKLYQSDKPIVIYKVNNGYNIYTDFSEKFILTEKNIEDITLSQKLYGGGEVTGKITLMNKNIPVYK